MALAEPGARVRRYNHQEIEGKWQQRWETDALYHAEVDPSKPKHYALVMFPYTSGDLHLGHWWNFALADVQTRYKRMQGFNVLFPPGFDSFGFPAENAAIKNNIQPRTWTMENIRNMERQWRTMGASYDWQREVATCQPEYYHWNQWFFLKLLERGLAYKKKGQVNWCPTDKAVLANEQVEDGLCWRCETPVIKRELEQWYFRITDYADELLDFTKIEWPEKIKAMQTNWVGRSEGVEFALEVEGGEHIKVFTTRVDTVFGMTYVVLAPEHELVAKLTTPEQKAAVDAYVAQTRLQTEIERMSTEKEKSGVFIGSYAVNPANNERVPIWIADYVLASYGTGAIMAVPASDERDWEFARRFGLPIKVVVRPNDAPDEVTPDQLPDNKAFTADGTMVNSGHFSGLSNDEAWDKIADWFQERKVGERHVNYRMRDWLISRQRYWGTPIPVVYCPTDGIVPVPTEQLPVLLPEDVQFEGLTGENPLSTVSDFVNTTCPKCGGAAKRETDTMDGFMDSSWYFLRFASPSYDQAPGYDPAAVKYWLPVDQYMGGAEHAVMHLLYARFFTKALRDMGLIDLDEPFRHLFNQGIVLGPDGHRMSKSKGNVVNPDEHVNRSGADSVRGWLAFLGPWDAGGPINTSALGAIQSLVHDIWELAAAELPTEETGSSDADLRRLTHTTIREVSERLENFRFNTAVSEIMKFRNGLKDFRREGSAGSQAWKEATDTLLLLIAPLFPHVAEELWTDVRVNGYSVHLQSWPKYEPAYLVQAQANIVVQVNGKMRDQVQVDSALLGDEARIRDIVLALPKVQQQTDGKTVRKFIYVPGKLANIVAG